MIKKEIKQTEEKFRGKLKQKRIKIKSLKYKKRDLYNLSLGRALSIDQAFIKEIEDKNATE